MSHDDFDTTGSLDWEEGLPRPRWDLIEAWVEARGPGRQRQAWIDALTGWLAELGTALGEYDSVESEHFLALAPRAGSLGAPLLRFAERGRAALLSTLNEVADFDAPGKHVVVALRDREDYYRYVSAYYPEGEHGGSAGVQIREGYPHVALCGKDLWALENCLAHELTHVALRHRSMPQWLEEGLAQMVEHDLTGRSLLEVDEEMAGRHKRHWRKHGLDEFWRGEGFFRPGKAQELSYQLAEILVRLLVEEGRPRWFGWDREPERRLFAFLRDASGADCGESVCRDRLGVGLEDLAAKFLGRGAWSQGL